MFRNTKDPSSGSLVQCFAKNYSNGSIVSVDMDVVGFMAAYCNPICVCVCVYSSPSRKVLCYGTPTTPMSTDTTEQLL